MTLPSPNVRVLVFDKQLDQWRIGRIEERQGVSWWVFDPQIYESLNDERFIKWDYLPEKGS